ncbi:MAG: phosphoribosylformylglycinamidine synthase subunit PurQ [Synechococcus sp. SB0665_bin_28]|nr:phosphoribosylformylglycinamidine synthase subunit PurQ [Synechococcus sp. SB0665_bin_28]MYF19849.1 phosphoribosylformylglycinamidine synthase subunit PurQ [Synechococcus sp. SB0677_bin_5]
MHVGVAVFPGANCDRDVGWALAGCLGWRVTFLWHRDATLPRKLDALILPGGFSYGDYLRCGAIASSAPLLGSVADFAATGGPVLGICNGFQVLTEAGLLPGGLIRNRGLHFVCRDQGLQVESCCSPWLRHFAPGDALTLPIAHGEGCYHIDPPGLRQLEDHDQVALRYLDNPNGSVGHIAGVSNKAGNVLGLMPHPERACDQATGGTDGQALFRGLARWMGFS